MSLLSVFPFFQVSLEDKLMALSMAQSATSKEHPNLNSMVTLLTQALQSQDKNLLEVSFPFLLFYPSSHYISFEIVDVVPVWFCLLLILVYYQ